MPYISGIRINCLYTTVIDQQSREPEIRQQKKIHALVAALQYNKRKKGE